MKIFRSPVLAYIGVIIVAVLGFTKTQEQQRHFSALLKVECQRSVAGASLRSKVIHDLTKPVPIANHSDLALVRTVNARNAELAGERADLEHTGSKIPNVKC